MNPMLHRLVSCTSISAIFTLIALASGQNYFLVALAFISGIACGWISADFKGFAVAVKDRLMLMKAEVDKKPTPYEKGMKKINRAYTLAGLWFLGVWTGQAIVMANLLFYVFSDDMTFMSGVKEDKVKSAVWLVFFAATWILSFIWVQLVKDTESTVCGSRKKLVRDIRCFRQDTSFLLSHGWVVFYTLRLIKNLAVLIEAIPLTLGWLWRHSVGLIKSAHTDGRLVSSTCVAFGMVIGYAIGLKTDSLFLGTIGGGVGGALFALVDWYVLSIMLGWREKASVPDSN